MHVFLSYDINHTVISLDCDNKDLLLLLLLLLIVGVERVSVTTDTKACKA